MEEQQAIKMIEALSNVNGASGFENEVTRTLRQYGEGLGGFSEDCMRNLYLRRKENRGGKPVVQINAHSDEVGFMVQAVQPNGMLRFIPLGGWVANNIPAHKVRVRNAEGNYIPGIVATKPPHFMTPAERNAPAEISSMAIDIGASSLEEAVQDFKVRIGEPIVPDVNFEYLPEKGLMYGKAFDCRLGCAASLQTLRGLRNEELAVDVVCDYSVQEEMGLRGAAVTANTIKPDLAIVFEGCPADDTFTEPFMIQTAIRRGPMLRHIDKKMITNPRFQRFALDLARREGIPVQEAVRTGGSTNGAPIHLSGRGVPVIVVGLPVRYIHTHYGIAAFSDFQNAVKLVCRLLKALTPDLIHSF
ncbi:M42 family peptidase [Caproiciproducens sp. NJN-50]|uniref:M42 family metallopeptidase n=1 Tax=Acutalibacteraceae TaxID=3082771 RepID=UPI000FFE2930|nr:MULTISPECIES: M20/M25/M40 family metallo-hydrolase [Acutalibacteraceae]QAT50053.1 M42 family peptidase [Caproiciproducens sp. NJN-50]